MNNKEAIKYLRQICPQEPACWLDIQRTIAIGMAIEALNKNNGKDISVTPSSIPDKAFLDRMCFTCNAIGCSEEDKACKEEWCDYIIDAKIVQRDKNTQFKELLEETKEELRPKEPFEGDELEKFEAIEFFVASVKYKLNKLSV